MTQVKRKGRQTDENGKPVEHVLNSEALVSMFEALEYFEGGLEHHHDAITQAKQNDDMFAGFFDFFADMMRNALKRARVSPEDVNLDDYEPFGQEWRNHLMKMPKEFILDIFIDVAKKRDECQAVLKLAREEITNELNVTPRTNLLERIDNAIK